MSHQPTIEERYNKAKYQWQTDRKSDFRTFDQFHLDFFQAELLEIVEEIEKEQDRHWLDLSEEVIDPESYVQGLQSAIEIIKSRIHEK